jgi:hypothetical protein
VDFVVFTTEHIETAIEMFRRRTRQFIFVISGGPESFDFPRLLPESNLYHIDSISIITQMDSLTNILAACQPQFLFGDGHILIAKIINISLY